jgi:hypothetical protein
MPAFFPKTLYKARARIEQAVGKLKRFKRIALRCEKTAQNYGSIPEGSDTDPQKPHRTPHQAPAAVHNSGPPRRASGGRPHGREIGIPIEKLDSLRALLKPKVAEKILDAYWQKNGDKPKIYTIDLARRFVAIAKETERLNDTMAPPQ